MKKHLVFTIVIAGTIFTILTFAFYISLKSPPSEPTLPPPAPLCEAYVTAEVLSPFIVDGKTSEYLSIRIIDVINYTGEPLIKKDDEVMAYVEGFKDFGCKDLQNNNTHGAIELPIERGDCENIGKPEKLYANWTVTGLNTGDTFKAPISFSASENHRIYVTMSDSKIELL